MESKLPERFEEIHNFSMYLHDSLAQIVAVGERKGIFDCVTSFDSEEKAKKMAELSGKELWDWLEDEDETLVRELSYKQIFVAVLSDFCHFVYEALKASKKGKLPVTYTLLRKPFKDNLLIMEWLLADPEDLMDRFFSGEAEKTAIDLVSSERKQEIIEEAMNKTEFSGNFDSEFLYKVRYDKKADFGLEKIWNKAIHLVTTYEHMKTEEKNLNFVFSDFQSKVSQWEYLYWIVPSLLYHAVEVAEALLKTITEVDEDQIFVRSMLRNLNFLFAQDPPDDNEEFSEFLNQVGEIFDFNCPNCGTDIEMSRENIKTFAAIGEVECQNCSKTVDVKPLFQK